MKSNKSQISLNSRFNIPIAKTCLTNDDLNAVTRGLLNQDGLSKGKMSLILKENGLSSQVFQTL